MLSAVVLLPLLLGPVASGWAARQWGRRGAATAAGVVAVGALVALLPAAATLWSGPAVAEVWRWLPSLGLDWALRLDALGLFFAGLIVGMGLLVIGYARYYLTDRDPPGKFYATLMLFMAAMLGVVLADNLLLLVIFWELTSLTSFLLVGYWNEQTAARRGARQALILTGTGGLLLTAGALLLGTAAGTFTISELLPLGASLQSHPFFPWALGLILVGAFTKSAQFPFHFWLPDAMAAPTPVSAYLHSATMVKAGLFLLLRLHPVLADAPLFQTVVVATGLATFSLGAVVALFKHDLKGLLAYSTVSHLGLIMALIGLGTVTGVVGAVLHLFNHALFKAALFMSAGIVDHETGSRDLRRVGGLARFLPWTALLASCAAAGMAGVPLFNGFVSKEYFLAEMVAVLPPWVPLLVTAASAFSVAYAARFVHDTFFNGPPQSLPNPHPHEPPVGMQLPVAILASGTLLFGVAPTLAEPLVARVAAASTGTTVPELHLALWHGLGWPLLMSAAALAAGVAGYAWLARGRRLHRFEIDALFGRRTGRWLFGAAIARLVRFATWLIRRLDNGSLTRTTAAIVMVTLALLATWWSAAAVPETAATAASSAPATQAAGWPALLLWALVAGAALLLFFCHRQRVVAILLSGVVGLVSAVAFALLSAPDLAMTQIAVEVVSTLLLFLALAYLPKKSPAVPWGHGALALALAVPFGAGVGWLAWQLLTTPRESISWYFLAESVPQGGGSNVVNVILVDFRGYDTFGEITVLGVAALAAWALFAEPLRAHRPAPFYWPLEQRPFLLQVVLPVVVPMGLMIAVYLFLRGHNQPGGGFIAGLVTAALLLLIYLAHGIATTNQWLRPDNGWRFAHTIGWGLAIAAATGIAPFALGYPFLTSTHGTLTLPLLGEIPLASAALFDLGVYVTVVGATLLLLTTLATGRRYDQPSPPSPQEKATP